LAEEDGVDQAAARRYGRVSYWLETCGDDLTPRPALDGSIDVDVAVLGAGFTGLWTAYHLAAADPSLRVAVVERDVAGFGASGRNGGWCCAEFSLGTETLTRRVGHDGARRMLSALHGAVARIGAVAAEEGIDVHYRRGGELLLARGGHQWPGVAREHAALVSLGFGSDYSLLGPQEVAGRVRARGAVGALYTPHCAALHPGRLVRGLAHAVERRGVRIYEGTAVTRVWPGRRPRLETARGDVRARTVVLAAEAYLSGLPGYRRAILPVYSLIVLTEPLSPEQWAALGWRDHECLASNRYTVDYLARTADGRILFGGRGAPYHFGSRIADRFDRHARAQADLRRALVSWFPALRGVRFSYAWGGPLGMDRDGMPRVSYAPGEGLALAGGYTGQGVTLSHLCGHILADLILERQTARTTLPIVGHPGRRWEPEPLRWLGVRVVQEGLRRVDQRGDKSGRAPTGRSLAERLLPH